MADATSSKNAPHSFQDALDRLDEALDAPSPTMTEIAGADLRALKTEVVAQVADLSKQTLAQVTAQVTDGSALVKALGAEGVAFLASNGPQLAQELAEQGAELGRALNREVRARPWLFIGGAAVTALAVGALIGAKSRRKSGMKAGFHSTEADELIEDRSSNAEVEA